MLVLALVATAIITAIAIAIPIAKLILISIQQATAVGPFKELRSIIEDLPLEPVVWSDGYVRIVLKRIQATSMVGAGRNAENAELRLLLIERAITI